MSSAGNEFAEPFDEQLVSLSAKTYNYLFVDIIYLTRVAAADA